MRSRPESAEVSALSPSDVAKLMGDRDGGKRAEGLYFAGRAGSPVERALDAFRRTEQAA